MLYLRAVAKEHVERKKQKRRRKMKRRRRRERRSKKGRGSWHSLPFVCSFSLEPSQTGTLRFNHYYFEYMASQQVSVQRREKKKKKSGMKKWKRRKSIRREMTILSK